jgi:hypothetical protein
MKIEMERQNGSTLRCVFGSLDYWVLADQYHFQSYRFWINSLKASAAMV